MASMVVGLGSGLGGRSGCKRACLQTACTTPRHLPQKSACSAGPASSCFANRQILLGFAVINKETCRCLQEPVCQPTTRVYRWMVVSCHRRNARVAVLALKTGAFPSASTPWRQIRHSSYLSGCGASTTESPLVRWMRRRCFAHVGSAGQSRPMQEPCSNPLGIVGFTA